MSERISDIDFVMIWVDGNDLEWRKSKAKYNGDEELFNINDVRYRDWDTLHYWFRCVEKFAPWVRKIHFVTCGHVPQWLKLEHPKLNFVKHSDYIAAEYLPTFSSHPIELNLHRIEGLSEKFVYFNDDMFLIAPVKEEDFFVNGLPRGYGVLNPPTADKHGIATIIMNNLGIIEEHYDFKTQLKKHWRKWFHPIYGSKIIRTCLLLPWMRYVGFLDLHLPSSFLKSTFEEVWQKEEDLLKTVSSHRFRDTADVNQWVMSYWQVASGRFVPGDPRIGRAFYLSGDVSGVADIIRKQKMKMICLNDSEKVANIDMIRQQIAEAFDSIVGEKSSFEK